MIALILFVLAGVFAFRQVAHTAVVVSVIRRGDAGRINMTGTYIVAALVVAGILAL